jgi:hypothetical protein
MSPSVSLLLSCVDKLLGSRDQKRLLRVQRQLAGYKLLIIDELGYVPLSQTGAELVFEVFSLSARPSFTEGDDLAAAKSQSAAIAKAKSSLKAAVDKVLGQSAGFRPVSVTSDMKDGRPIASVVLLKGEEFKTVQEQLE